MPVTYRTQEAADASISRVPPCLQRDTAEMLISDIFRSRSLASACHNRHHKLRPLVQGDAVDGSG